MSAPPDAHRSVVGVLAFIVLVAVALALTGLVLVPGLYLLLLAILAPPFVVLYVVGTGGGGSLMLEVLVAFVGLVVLAVFMGQYAAGMSGSGGASFLGAFGIATGATMLLYLGPAVLGRMIARRVRARGDR